MSTGKERTLVQEIEGHLLLAAAREEGRAAAARAASRLGWLTDSQRDDLERNLETEYLALARTSWQRTAERAEELRREYESAYHGLRRRLLACFLLGCALLAATGLMLLSTTRGSSPVHSGQASRNQLAAHFWLLPPLHVHRTTEVPLGVPRL